MRDITNITKVVDRINQVASAGMISQKTQDRIFRRLTGEKDWSKLSEWDKVCTLAQLEVAKKMRQRSLALHDEISEEVRNSETYKERLEAERDIFQIEFRTPEQLLAERTYQKGIAKVTTAPEISVDAEWWQAQECAERKEKTAIREKIRNGGFVSPEDLQKYDFDDYDTLIAEREEKLRIRAERKAEQRELVRQKSEKRRELRNRLAAGEIIPNDLLAEYGLLETEQAELVEA